MRLFSTVLIVATAFFAGPADAATPARLVASDAQISAFFDAFASEAMAELDIPGAAVVVVRDGRTVLARGYGVADLDSGHAVDVDRSLFRAASISKVLPWLLAMQMVEEGRLELDRDVNAYLDFEVRGTPGVPITMRHLMTHTAGFPERFHGVFDPDLSRPLGEVLRENVPELAYVPGTTLAYSNYGAALAGHIVERLRGQPWETLVARRIFAPLGMERSTVRQPVPGAMRDRLVSTYEYGSNVPGPFRTTPLAPMGALTSTPADMGRLLSSLVAGASGTDGVVQAGTLQQMMALQRPLGPGLPDGLGLGFLVGEYRGIRFAGHAGNMTTLATDLEVLPGYGIGWYYVFNSQGAYEGARKLREKLLHAFIDRFLVPESAPPLARGPSTASEVVGSYVGTRRLHAGPLMFSGLMNTTAVEIAEGDGLRIESSGVVSRWVPDGPDRFLDTVTGIPLSVTRDAAGRVVRIASAALYPAAEFEAAPAYLGAVPWAAAFAFGVLVLGAPVRAGAVIVRRLRQRRAGTSGVTPPLRLQRWARIGYRVLLLAIVAWGAAGLALAIDFALLFEASLAIRLLLAGLAVASIPAAAVLATDALLGWRDPSRSRVARFGAVLVALAALVMAVLLVALDVINVSTNW